MVSIYISPSFPSQPRSIPSVLLAIPSRFWASLQYPKKIIVNLTNQHLYTIQKNDIFHDFLISSGTWNRTPTGTFKIWAKIRSQKMSGGSKELGTYYYLPNVPYILFFYNDQIPKNLGYSIHGTYWHDNFGQPMSHGCVNMKTPETKFIYDWADENTPITITGKYQYISSR